MPRNRSNKPLIPLDFGDALKAARKNQNLTTTELARRMDKTDPSISRYESGQGLPPKTTMEAIERELKADLRKEWEKVKPYWDEYLRTKKLEKANDTEKQLLNLYDLLREIFRSFIPDLPELPKELEPLTLEEIIKRLEEWLTRARGNLIPAPPGDEGRRIVRGAMTAAVNKSVDEIQPESVKTRTKSKRRR